MPVTVETKKVGTSDGSTLAVTYTNLDVSDTNPAPIDLVEFADRSVQVSGAFNGGSVVIEGSNDGETWVVLTDPQGNPISITAPKIEQLQELTLYVRPLVPPGSPAIVKVVFLLRRASGLRT